jgi:hypothetical protein
MDRYCYAVILVLLLSVSAFAQTIERRTVYGNGVDITKWAAYLRPDAVYTVATRRLDFNVNTHTGKGWLLIHDGTKVKNIMCVNGITSCIWEIVPCASKLDCFAKASALKLIYDEADYENETDCTSIAIGGAVVVEQPTIKR